MPTWRENIVTTYLCLAAWAATAFGKQNNMVWVLQAQANLVFSSKRCYNSTLAKAVILWAVKAGKLIAHGFTLSHLTSPHTALPWNWFRGSKIKLKRRKMQLHLLCDFFCHTHSPARTARSSVSSWYPPGSQLNMVPLAILFKSSGYVH